MSRKDLVRLLGDGHSQVAAAGALGISESRVSQLLEDPELRAEIAALRAMKLGRESRIEDKKASLEEKILDKLEKAIPLMALARPLELARVLQIVAGARKPLGVERDVGQAGVQVSVLLPAGILGSKFKLSQMNEVIELEEGVPLVTAGPSKMREVSDDRSRVKLQAGAQGLSQVTADQI